MTTETFLTIDDEPISVTKAFRYLQINRKLDGFIGEIVRQFVIERELNSREDLQVPATVVEQAIIDFRLQQQLTDAKQFQEWLTSNGSNYETFHDQVETSFKLRKLKEDVGNTRIQEYFIERKVFLDRVVLSRIIVDKQELAEELHTQIQEGTSSFEQLAREYSLTDDRLMNGMVGPVSRGSMPDMLRSAVDLAKPGDVIGPLGLDNRWGLFRIEEFLTASMDDPQIQQTLQDELFEQWLGEKMQTLPIRLQIND
jgi:parvulin-like peptidyl-prolyl isomerase